ncbi:hypothetical protein J6590_047052 [Homalodisca vitripennis]|nr:hypothetical protein J6590_047052 [Homalodisca vitripennis]
MSQLRHTDQHICLLSLMLITICSLTELCSRERGDHSCCVNISAVIYSFPFQPWVGGSNIPLIPPFTALSHHVNTFGWHDDYGPQGRISQLVRGEGGSLLPLEGFLGIEPQPSCRGKRYSRGPFIE